MHDNVKRFFIGTIWVVLSGMSACGVKLVPETVSHSGAFLSTEGSLSSFLTTVAICWPLWLAATFGVAYYLTRERPKAVGYTLLAIPVMALAAALALGAGFTF